ncbi:MAG: hydantoinase/oxoprolinase family protein, partial [Alphaproteobacteria bacterium]|nr:hydantoinase/oxoprolinase family protein [Alphaproteobacteria bacterium]
YRVAVDIGGTFTDVMLVEEASGTIRVAKVPTVPADPSRGFMDGIDKAFALHGIDPRHVGFMVHGTTVATNTIIQGKGAKAGLLTSAGFRDVLEIAYQTRPVLYDTFYDKPKPLVPRYLCLGVPERIGPDGEVLTPLDEDAVRLAARKLEAEGVQAIAVAFLHSYRDPAHERRAGAIVADECPGLPVVLSSDVCPEYREYPRTSTTVVNAVLMPSVGAYVDRLETRLGAAGIAAGLHLMTSGGGIITGATARRFPVQLIESGPAAGVIAAAFIGQFAGVSHILSLDIGGTTAKAALVDDGVPRLADEFEVGAASVATITASRGQGYPVKTPVISLVEIGAGGGSIAAVDPGGALTVGPESAGADPGPACYGRGNPAPTLTDANVVLGRINPAYFLGGELAIDSALAEKAVREKVAEPLGMNTVEAARAIIDIANARMTAALNLVTIEKGIDPRDYALVASGGAGPLHAVAIAEALGVARVLVPATPGLNSALGLIATDLKHEYVRTHVARTAMLDAELLSGLFAEIEASGRALLVDEGVPPSRMAFRREVDMCYVGQSYYLRIRIPDEPHDVADALAAAFHAAHEVAYGFSSTKEATQVVNLRLTALGTVD